MTHQSEPSDPGPHQLSLLELSAALDEGKLSSAALTAHYLARIGSIDSEYRSVLAVNPDAQAIAAELDREQAASGRRGPLHGIPILVKDNLDTADRMPTTAGSLALAGTFASSDSTVVMRLRVTLDVTLAEEAEVLGMPWLLLSETSGTGPAVVTLTFDDALLQAAGQTTPSSD